MSKWIYLGLLALLVAHRVNCEQTIKVADALVVEAQPVEVSTEAAAQPDHKEAPKSDGPLKYDGAQLWRIPYSDQTYKNAVAELQSSYDVAMWNLNQTCVDMFVKKAAVNDATRLLQSANIPFDVLIEDVQQAIDEENPPKDQLDLWQNRNGDYRRTVLK